MSSQQTFHVCPTAELAERVLLPGDPGRALALAQLLLEKPLMFNHHRGLWGYTGMAADGEPLTIQSTGMGGPSAAIVLHELVVLGARRVIRVGTCGALDAELELGDLVVAVEAIAADGTSRSLGGSERLAADSELTEGLRRAQPALANAGPAMRHGTIVSSDLFYEPTPGRSEQWRSAGALAVEMEAATLFSVARAAGIQAACVLTVSDTFSDAGERQRIDEQTLRTSAEAMGAIAAAALS